MTQQPTPLYSMTMKAGETLLKDLSRSLMAAQASQVKTNARFQNWKAVIKSPPDTQAAGLAEAGLMGFFLDFMFGMPIFSGISDATKGMLQIGLMAHSEQGRDKAASNMPSMAAINALISQQGQRRNKAVAGQKMQSAQMKQMRQMVMMMVMMMMQQESEQGEGGEGSVVPDMASDVLRHPKLARFKQNRHSLACIREMFQAQADVVTPRFTASRMQAA